MTGTTRRLSSLFALEGGDHRHLYQQVYARIRKLIAAGALAPGARLPSSRTLGASLKVSRNSVALAYDLLVSDGWLEARVGSGTYVASPPPTRLGRDIPGRRPQDAPSERPFAVGLSGVDLFPIGEWNRFQSRRWKSMPRSALVAGHPAGWSGLREAISAHVSVTRGVACAPDQVFITSSARTGMGLAVRALSLAGQEVWIENPGYHAIDAELSSTLRPRGVRVDAEGMVFDEAFGEYPGAMAALLTPANQFPTGVPLSRRRRDQFLSWAADRGAWLFEDDYDAEFVFEGRPAPTLFSEDGAGRTVFMGTFNKLMFPALRLAFVVAPESEVERFATAARLGGEYPNVPNQMVLADYIEAGGVDRHLARCREAYGERRAVLLDQDFGDKARILPHRAGLHVLLTSPGLSSREIEARSSVAGVHVVGVHRLCWDGADDWRVLLGFSGFAPDDLRRAAGRLARAFG